MKKKIKKVWTLDDLKKEVKRLDPKTSDENEPAFKTALILLSALVVGANQKNIAKFTKIPQKFIAERAKRLRANGIWRGSKTNCDWFEKSGGIAFWCDVLVAEGLIRRVNK